MGDRGQSQTFSAVVDEYVKSQATRGHRQKTVDKKAYIMRTVLADVGNIQVRNITGRHMDRYFEMRLSKGIQPQSLNNELAILRDFFKWAAARKYIGAWDSPLGDRKQWKVEEKDLFRIPVGDFPTLLDSAGCERDRMVLALGIYLFLRASEMRTITMADVNLDGGWMKIKVHKSRRVDRMVIHEDLGEELERWLKFYRKDQGTVRQPGAWHLVPSRKGNQWVGTGYKTLTRIYDVGSTLRPERMISKPHLIVQDALVTLGYPIREDDGTDKGKSLMTGIHTLRRSGARAYYDELLLDSSYDRALGDVSAMLHHKSMATTEHYIGVDVNIKHRDDRLRGRRMYERSLPKATPADVVPLRLEG